MAGSRRSGATALYADICISAKFARVRTTLDLNDDLYRQIKVLAAATDSTATSLVEEGLRAVLEKYTGARGKKLPQFGQLTRVRGGVDINDSRKVRARLKNR